MRAYATTLVSVMLVGVLAGVTGANAQSRALPKGSSLAATPPIDQRGKQFRSLSRSRQRTYLRQSYQPSRHSY